MDGEGEQVEGHQDGGEVFLAVAEAVFEVVAVVLEHVEGFVLDLPSCPATGSEFDDIVWADGQIGDEAVAVGRRSCRVADLGLEPADPDPILAIPPPHPSEPTVATDGALPAAR